MTALINFYLTVRFLVIWVVLLGDGLLIFTCILGIIITITEIYDDMRTWEFLKTDLLFFLFLIILFLMSLFFMTCAVTYGWNPTLPSIWVDN